MDRNQIIDLLSVIVACDRRTTGEADITAWLATAGDLPFEDARDAVVAHYQESSKWIMPADVRRGVRAIRIARLADADDDLPTGDIADDPQAYLAKLRRTREAIAEGRPVLRQIGGAQ